MEKIGAELRCSGQRLPKGDVWTYDDFTPGRVLGQIAVTLDGDRIEQWESIFGVVGRDRALPRGLIVSALVEGFIRSGQPRPKGNVHASQTLFFTETVAHAGDVIAVSAEVVGRELRKAHKWVTFRLEARVADALLCSGDFLIIWAI